MDKIYVQPDLQLPPLGILALIAENNDVARVAAALNLSCATVRGVASVAAIDMLKRVHNAHTDEAMPANAIPDGYAALIQCVKRHVRSDVLNVIALLTPRERLEIFETFTYFRAFCNSPDYKMESIYGKV